MDKQLQPNDREQHGAPPNSEDERVIREVLPALCSAIRLLKASPKSHRFCEPLFRQRCQCLGHQCAPKVFSGRRLADDESKTGDEAIAYGSVE